MTETGKSSRFNATTRKTERSGVAVLMYWMREIIERENINLGMPDVDTTGKDRKSPDIIIYKSRQSKDVLCVIEAKRPHWDVLNVEDLIEPARKKANKRKARYFATTNFKELIWFSTERANKALPEEEQIIDKYTLSVLDDVDDLEHTRYSKPIKESLEVFLKKLFAVHSGKEVEPRLAIDEFLVWRLQNEIKDLAFHYRRIIHDKCHKDSAFAKKLKNWFLAQAWSFAWAPHDFDKAARQTAYLLVNKILFYNLLQAKRSNELAPLDIPTGLRRGSQLQSILQSYFKEALKIDYETIYMTDFIDDVAFPDEIEVVEKVKGLINVLKRYDFSKLGYDVIGRIFERLIPQEERHNLGQYFTNSEIVDLILRFCMKHEDDMVIDPSCGAGTFLVRAYQHKKLMNQRKKHEDILASLWGCDIAKFPAHLATINLAIKDLGVDQNYPNVIHEDFFKILATDQGFGLPDKFRKSRAKTLGIKERDIIFPNWFDAVIGNPPYTRQEEIPETGVDKFKLIDNALNAPSGKTKLAEISKRAGIHAYFFVHGMKFLKDGGHFGFIVSNSWLDVDYGKGLQEFFLRNYRIVAIIESKVERWFEEADINTCIVILQKCNDENERNENLVRFAYLKKPLRHFIPPTQDIWEKQVERKDAIDNLKNTILAHSNLYENDELRIFPKSQKKLWDEGFNIEKNKYVGAKWGKYLRAPEIFFKILKKSKDKLVHLKEVADIRRGFTTGANKFFYLTEEEIKRRKIEKQFWMHKDENGKWMPNHVIVSPREGKTVVLNPLNLKKVVLIINKEKKKLKGKKVLTQIKRGEREEFHKRSTCSSRNLWYSLTLRQPWPILFPMIHNDRQVILSNKPCVQVDHNLFEIKPKRKRDVLPYLCFLLSTISILIKELTGRVNLGEGALKTEGIDIERLLVPVKFDKETRRKLRRLAKKNPDPSLESVFKDLQARNVDDVTLDKVRPDRRKLDKIILGDILGLTDNEQLEVYRAVIDLVKSRLDKAKSLGKKNKTKEGIDVEAFIKTVMKNIGNNTLGNFYKEKILTQKTVTSKKLIEKTDEVTIEKDLYGWRLSSGKKYIECDSEEKARYLKVFLDTGIERVEIPENEKYLKRILPELEKIKESNIEITNSFLESIVSVKTRDKLHRLLWLEIFSEK
jgi:type I restriction-modification system DNA methylase subunit